MGLSVEGLGTFDLLSGNYPVTSLALNVWKLRGLPGPVLFKERCRLFWRVSEIGTEENGGPITFIFQQQFKEGTSIHLIPDHWLIGKIKYYIYIYTSIYIYIPIYLYIYIYTYINISIEKKEHWSIGTPILIICDLMVSAAEFSDQMQNICWFSLDVVTSSRHLHEFWGGQAKKISQNH